VEDSEPKDNSEHYVWKRVAHTHSIREQEQQDSYPRHAESHPGYVGCIEEGDHQYGHDVVHNGRP